MVKKTLRKLKGDANLLELVRGSLITFFLKSAGILLSYLLVYYITVKFGKAGVGYYSLTNQLLIIASSLAAMGTTTSVLRYVGQYNNDESRSTIKVLYGLIWKLIFPFAIVIGLIGFLTAEILATQIFKNEAYTSAIQLLSMLLPLFVMDRIAIEFIRGFKLLKVSEFIRTVSRPLFMLAALFILWNENLQLIYIIYMIIGAVILNFLLSNSTVLGKIARFENAEKKEINGGELMRVSSPMMVSGLTGLFITSTPLFILEAYAETEQVGIYGVAFKIAQLLTMILVVVNTIAAPKFSELFWSKKKDELQRVILQSTKLMFWTALGLSIALILGGKQVLSLFGSDFKEAYIPLIILIIGQLINASTGSVGLFLNMSGNQKILRNTAFIALAAMLISAFALIPQYHILGASISASIGIVLWNLLCILLVKRNLGYRTYYVPFL